MIKKSKAVLLGAVWVGLFALTASIAATQHKIDNREAVIETIGRTSKNGAQEFRDAVFGELLGLPLTTDSVSLADLGRSDPGFLEALNDQMSKNRHRLRECKHVISTSRRETEYFEVSFVVSPITEHRFRLEQIAMERGTLELSDAEELCIIHAFETFELTFDHAPASRVRFPFCINRNQQQEI